MQKTPLRLRKNPHLRSPNSITMRVIKLIELVSIMICVVLLMTINNNISAKFSYVKSGLFNKATTSFLFHSIRTVGTKN
ncbi:MAG: hypothetical protein NVS1B13_12500 [Flavisolibacter sp.]